MKVLIFNVFSILLIILANIQRNSAANNSYINGDLDSNNINDMIAYYMQHLADTTGKIVYFDKVNYASLIYPFGKIHYDVQIKVIIDNEKHDCRLLSTYNKATAKLEFVPMPICYTLALHNDSVAPSKENSTLKY